MDYGVMKTNTYQEKGKVKEIDRSTGQRSPTRSPNGHLVASVRHGE